MTTIDTFTITPDEVKFTVSGLPGQELRYAVFDVGGRRVTDWNHWNVGGEARVPVHESLGSLEPGSYVLHVHPVEDFEDKHSERPKPGHHPATYTFHLLSSSAHLERGGTPTPTPVTLQRTTSPPTPDRVLSDFIVAVTTARRFRPYDAYVRQTVCQDRGGFPVGAYDTLVDETRKFLAEPVRVVDQEGRVPAYLEDGQLPYVAAVVRRFPDAVSGDPCSDIDLGAIVEGPFPVELIWSYWQEEGGLVQTLNHILARFQNRHPARGVDRLARFDLNPLRPLRHLLWSWAEDEMRRLTVRRRAAEYQYEYGLELVGRAVPGPRRYVERRNRFLESFHTLLHEAQVFFSADDDTTVVADGFPVLNALRDTHLVLSEGAHNQFGDLPTEARIQMLVMQWLLAQPEMRDFLGGRPMVAYDETWMDRVDSMRAIQGWSSTSVTHFNELAVYGEQLLLSIRWGHWNDTALTADNGKNWARTWRNAIQRYVHAYRAATGADLVTGIDVRMPAQLLARREARERTRV